MVTVTKRFAFEACHHLPNYEGKCHNVHGHSYKLEVTVTGPVRPEGAKEGMIIDFKDLKAIVDANVIELYDHKDLNEYFDNPTAEIMVRHIGDKIQFLLTPGLKLKSVRLWETEDSYAEYIPEKGGISLDSFSFKGGN